MKNITNCEKGHFQNVKMCHEIILTNRDDYSGVSLSGILENKTLSNLVIRYPDII